jgi:DNA polymerase III delta prime subunit
MFFLDKYIPTSKEDIFFHKDIYDILEIMSSDNSIPHLLFHGPVGSGKKTMVKIFLEMLFGDSVKYTKNVKYTICGSCNNETEEIFKQSFHHILIEPRGNNHDRYLIHDVMELYVSKVRYNFNNSKHTFKVVIINNVDIMSESVQFSLRRTIEKYSEQCRFILISNSISKVINPISSRCKCISVKTPNDIDIINYINYISVKESIYLSLDKLTYIKKMYDGNIKNVLWQLELCKLNQYYIEKIKTNFIKMNELLENLNIKFDYEKYIKTIENADNNNIFLTKNINRFINNIGNEIFDIFKNIFKNYITESKYNFYFTKITDYFTKVINIVNKKKKYIQYDKKCKYEDCILKIGILLYNSLQHISFLDPLTSKDYIYRELYKIIKSKDLNKINDIRNIIFNLLITNITGTEIIKNLVDIIIDDEKINSKKKLEIFEVCKEAEYGIIKGRREINQFDNLIVSIIHIIKN